MVAYHEGKAAKMAAPATISHTSLPSQMGPMRVDGDAPLGVVVPHEGVEHAHPEVEAFEDEETHPEDGDDHEPDVVEVHHGGLLVDEGRDPVLIGLGRGGGRAVIGSCRGRRGPRRAPGSRSWRP